MALVEHAPAKVNLFLHITGRRDDGYHILESLAVFTLLGDLVQAEAGEALSLEIDGPFAGQLSAEHNLMLHAGENLRRAFGVSDGAALRLTKNIPVGSGLGGGSADAAATLRVLARLWQLDIADARFASVARALGADVPACFYSETVLMQGIGEVLTPVVPDAPMWLVLAHPGVPLLTVNVFDAWAGKFSGPVELEPLPPVFACRNDLEPAALSLRPEISDTLAALRAEPHCILARMSGSGATCFGWFADEESARLAAGSVTTRYPRWWVAATRTL